MKIIQNKFFPYLIILAVVLISSFLLWLPFLLKTSSLFGLNIERPNFQYIYKNYDGPLYVVIAKTFYKPELIDNLKLEFQLSTNYFAAHLPLYPLFIYLFSYVFGFLKSMIFVNVLFSIILAISFYYILKKLQITLSPLILTIIFLLLPRFLVVRSIGAPESMFILWILLSLFSFERKKYFLSGIFGCLAVFTKTPAILLFPAYLLAILDSYLKDKKINWQWLNVLLIPFGLIIVFFIYQKQYGNFFAYFNSESFVPLVFPFSVFNFQKNWVGTAWLEDVFFYFLIYLLTVISLKNFKFRSFFYFALVFFIATTFVQHRDISRYSLPLWPLACIAFEKFLTSKKFVLALLLILPAIYLYAWNFLVYNIMPISNWQPFL